MMCKTQIAIPKFRNTRIEVIRKKHYMLKSRLYMMFMFCMALCAFIVDNKLTHAQAWQAGRAVEADRQLFYVRQSVMENGQVIYQGNDSDVVHIKDAFLYELEKSETVRRMKKSEGAEFINSDTIYSSKEYSMTSAKNVYSGLLVAEENIQISGNANKLDKGAIYSKNGNILISGNTVEIQSAGYTGMIVYYAYWN